MGQPGSSGPKSKWRNSIMCRYASGQSSNRQGETPHSDRRRGAPELNQSTVFSKIDLKWGYHQVQIDPGSRSITTFVTLCGLYRYKRLMIGINAAPEIH